MKRQARATALGSLATLAVLSMAAPAMADEAVPPVGPGVSCGTPAVPAVFQTVVHAAVYAEVVHPAVHQVIPAVTHIESLWTRQVQVVEREFRRTTAEGYDAVEWLRATDVVEREFARVVVDAPAVPAVPAQAEVGHWETQVVSEAVHVTEHEFVQHQTGRTRWELPGWNAQVNPQSIGWSWNGNTRETLVSEAVTEQVWVVDSPAVPAVPATPAVTHVETVWSQAVPAGADWAPTGEERVVDTIREIVLLAAPELPEGDGWVATGNVVHVDGTSETAWSEGTPEGSGWVATGAERVARTETETTATPSATAPAGAGWSPVAGSETVVVDSPEQQVEVSPAWVEQVLVTPEWTEQVLVTPAVPAGPACPADPGQPGGPGTPADPADPVEEEPGTTPVVLPHEEFADDDDESGAVVVPAVAVLDTAAYAEPVKAPVAVPTAVDAGLAEATATAPAGTDWLTGAGLLALAAGTALYVVPTTRRRERG